MDGLATAWPTTPATFLMTLPLAILGLDVEGACEGVWMHRISTCFSDPTGFIGMGLVFQRGLDSETTLPQTNMEPEKEPFKEGGSL